MTRPVKLTIVVSLSLLFIASINIEPGGAATTQGANEQVQIHEQSLQNSQPAQKNKLSKRNKAILKMTEAQKSRRESNKNKLSKHNQAVIRQSEAAKKKQKLIESTNAVSTPK